MADLNTLHSAIMCS